MPDKPDQQQDHHFDVIVVGAGLSGIGAAYYLQTRCPAKSFTLLEAREEIGGTWDLFRYLAFARTRTCTPWATASGPGDTRGC